MEHNAPDLVVLCIEYPELYNVASGRIQDNKELCHGVKVQVKQCKYNEAPEQLKTGGSKLICTVSDHSDEVSLIFNEDEPDQKTKEGRKPASLPQSATATYKVIREQLGNGDFVDERTIKDTAKKTYDDKVAKETGITGIFEAAKSSNSVIIQAPRLSMNLVFELVLKLAQGMSPDLVLQREAFQTVEDPSRHITIDGAFTYVCTMKRSEIKACACAESGRVCGIPTENKSKAKIIEDRVQKKQTGVVFPRFKTPETHGAQPYNESGLVAGFFRAHNALEKLCPAQAYGYAPWCKSMSVGSENFIWNEEEKPLMDLAIVVVRGGNAQVCKLTRGITVQEAYVRRARTFGTFDYKGQQGKVTVGAVIAAHTGYSGDNWHFDIAGVDRYDLIDEAVAEALEEFYQKSVSSKREEDVTKLAFDIQINLSPVYETDGKPAKRALNAIMKAMDVEKKNIIE
ncbi:uncharacterized protein BBA_04794 [Beauveria bassiana ARSEF 2860]|uniref:Uncharacterized protein n=1 Tax=Beauveria bassiana (strain ARSEF 2860) TaxID=655819 RepID=J5JV26_BEAB2|nr:uncharacterized protein BBA_04794 [Beauveria bassiana ARSEF 2860]EJP66301.1 hypothetical protein BBA_04794 [Beauveria bassiana ARSEF 2860]